jgi:ABC-type Zn2+ transport system substrate-binding protein/surface adhesin
VPLRIKFYTQADSGIAPAQKTLKNIPIKATKIKKLPKDKEDEDD